MVDTDGVAARGEELRGGFARIEGAVAGGDTDLSRLGFWRLLRQVKADPALSAHWAEAAGRIDRAAFEASVRPRFPMWLGNLVLVLGALVGGLPGGGAVNAQDQGGAG